MISVEVILEIIKWSSNIQNLYLSEIEILMKQQKVRPEEFSSNHLDAPSLNVQLFSLHIVYLFSLHFH